MTGQERAGALIREGDELLRQGQLDEAEEAYHNALRHDPESAEAIYSIGCVYSHRGEFVQACEWAHKALAVDSGHRGAHGLLGNALLGLERHAEAKEALMKAADANGSPQLLGQIGLCCEVLGQLEEAEKVLRQALENDPSYCTRFAPVAWHAYSPLAADLHHFLARVLQRRGEIKEAKLHYHLAKRNDGTIELDPMYREIMSDAELENHPWFDAPPPPPEGGLKRFVWLACLDDFDSLEAEAAKMDVRRDIDDVVRAITATQHAVKLYWSARLRVVGDVLNGSGTPQPLFDALQTLAWKRLFEIAERFHSKALSWAEQCTLIKRLDFPWQTALLLAETVRRFIELEPQTGLSLATVAAELCSQAPSAEIQLQGRLMIAMALLRAGKRELVDQEIQKALAFAKACEAGTALEAYWTVAGLLCEQERRDDALGMLERCIEMARIHRLVGWEVRASLRRVDLLLRAGRAEEAYAECERLLPVLDIAKEQFSPGVVRSLFEATATMSGRTWPDGALAGLSPFSADEDAQTLYERARTALDDERWDDAIQLAERTEAAAWHVGHRVVVAYARHLKGTALAAKGHLDEAETILFQARYTAEPLAAHADLWPILIESARVAHELKKHGEAVEFLERALQTVRAKGDQERTNQTLRYLSSVLIEHNPRRAIDLFGESLKAVPVDDGLPPDWGEALRAYEAGDFDGAIRCFDRLMALDTEVVEKLRPLALANKANAEQRLGRLEEAENSLCAAHRLFAGQDDERAADCLQRLAHVRNLRTGDASEVLNQLVEFARGQGSPGMRRHLLVIAGEAAETNGTFDVAEAVLLEALELATSKDWADTCDEVSARHALGKLYRRSARYAEAHHHYLEALNGARALSDELMEAVIRVNMGIALRFLDRLDEAIDQYEHAIYIGDRLDRSIAAGARLNMASALFLLDRTAQGMNVAVDAYRVLCEVGDTERAVRCLLLLGQHVQDEKLPPDIRRELTTLVEQRVDSRDPTVRSWAAAREAERHARAGAVREGRHVIESDAQRLGQQRDRFNEAKVYINWARICLDLDAAETRWAALRARDIATAIGQSALVAESEEALLRCALRLGDDAAAEEGVDRLRRVWKRVRRGLRQDHDRVRLADRSTTLLDEYAAYLLGRGRPMRALEVYDMGRAQPLLDLYDIIEDEVPVNAGTISQLLADMPRETMLICLGWCGDRLVALSLTAGSDEPDVWPINITRERLVEALTLFEREVIVFRGEGASTWQRMVAPILADIAGRFPRDGLIILCVEEELQALPLHALLLPDGTPLLEHAAVVYAPNLEIFARLAQRLKEPAEGGYDFVCIGVAFQDEALALLQRFGRGPGLTGNHLDKTIVREMFEKGRILHIACHGHFDRDNHLESGLVIANTREVLAEHVLSVRDLLNWRLQAELAVLSACETGRGSASSADFLSLGRAFLAAGARAVVTSLWSVENKATQRLMSEFYRRLFSASRSGYADAAESLRRAQLEARKENGFCDWAAFKLTGWPFLQMRQDTGRD